MHYRCLFEWKLGREEAKTIKTDKRTIKKAHAR